jgi:hypothetical protein
MHYTDIMDKGHDRIVETILFVNRRNNVFRNVFQYQENHLDVLLRPVREDLDRPLIV